MMRSLDIIPLATRSSESRPNIYLMKVSGQIDVKKSPLSPKNLAAYIHGLVHLSSQPAPCVPKCSDSCSTPRTSISTETIDCPSTSSTSAPIDPSPSTSG
ncbi:hypothetical protein PV325_000146, partial [Microctonus aethiopoides]